jgi:hypothetical protein
VGFVAFVTMVANVVLFPPGPNDDDFPPVLILMTSVMSYVAALVAGVVLVPFPRWVTGPRFPFVRRRYAVMAALPLLWLVVPGLPWVQRVVLFAACETVIAACAAVRRPEGLVRRLRPGGTTGLASGLS